MPLHKKDEVFPIPTTNPRSGEAGEFSSVKPNCHFGKYFNNLYSQDQAFIRIILNDDLVRFAQYYNQTAAVVYEVLNTEDPTHQAQHNKYLSTQLNILLSFATSYDAHIIADSITKFSEKLKAENYQNGIQFSNDYILELVAEPEVLMQPKKGQFLETADDNDEGFANSSLTSSLASFDEAGIILSGDQLDSILVM